MAVLPICALPDSVLRRKAKRVPRIDSSIQRLIDDMVETMQEVKGVGLAAPQVGVSLRVVVLQMPGEEPFAIVNPQMVKRSGEQQAVEGCLSVPGYVGEIKRSASVTVKGWDRHGKSIRIKATGLLAEALEHEIDHLDGLVYIDHVEDKKKLRRIESMIDQ
jgi:peptide deformylase